jgi:hypothetical protein
MTMSKTAFGPFEALLQGSGQVAKGISAEKLAMAGRRAAAQYVDNGVPLNDSLTKEASVLDGVEREHVQRMCETANHTTFNAKFAQMQGDFRAPEFPVADASEVWDRLGNPGTEKTAGVRGAVVGNLLGQLGGEWAGDGAAAAGAHPHVWKSIMHGGGAVGAALGAGKGKRVGAALGSLGAEGAAEAISRHASKFPYGPGFLGGGAAGAGLGAKAEEKIRGRLAARKAEKTASVTSLDDYRIAPKPFHRSRGAEVMDKVASVADEERVVPKLAHANPMGDSLRLRTKLSAARDVLASRVGQFELRLASTESLLVTKMAEALKEGHAPEELLVVFGQADGSDEGIKHASRLLVQAVKTAIPKHRHGQIKLAFDNELVQSLQYKEASPASPIYRGFSNLAQIREDLAVAKVAHARVEDALKVQREQLVGMIQEKEAGALGGAIGSVAGGALEGAMNRRSGAKGPEAGLRLARGVLGGGLAGHAVQEVAQRLRAAKKNQLAGQS